MPPPRDLLRRAGAEPEEPFTLLGRSVPGWLHLRVVLLEPESERPYDSAEWRGALVVVEQGAVALMPCRGSPRPLPRGAVLWLAGLPLRAVANPHPEPALLSVMSRRDGSDGGGEED